MPLAAPPRDTRGGREPYFISSSRPTAARRSSMSLDRSSLAARSGSSLEKCSIRSERSSAMASSFFWTAYSLRRRVFCGSATRRNAIMVVGGL